MIVKSGSNDNNTFKGTACAGTLLASMYRKCRTIKGMKTM